MENQVLLLLGTSAILLLVILSLVKTTNRVALARKNHKKLPR